MACDQPSKRGISVMVRVTEEACRCRAAAQDVLTIAAPGFSVAALDLLKVGDRLRLGLKLLR